MFCCLAAFPAVDGEGQGSKEDAGDENLSGNGATKDAKLIGDALQGPEIPLKLERKIGRLEQKRMFSAVYLKPLEIFCVYCPSAARLRSAITFERPPNSFGLFL